MTDVSETMAHVKEALDAIHRALIELDATREVPDKTLDEAFKHLTSSKVKLERWIKENNDD
jgi:hypothetical protein